MKTVYGLVDPRDSRIRYVGCSVNVSHRMGTHYQDAKKGRKGKRCDWIRELLAEGLRAKTVWLGEAEGALAAELARFWIAEFRRHGDGLTNQSHGGPGNPGLHHDTETRARIGAYWKGRKRGAETRQRMSEAQRIRSRHKKERTKPFTRSEETRQRMSEAAKGKPKSPEHRENMRLAWIKRKADPNEEA